MLARSSAARTGVMCFLTPSISRLWSRPAHHKARAARRTDLDAIDLLPQLDNVVWARPSLRSRQTHSFATTRQPRVATHPSSNLTSEPALPCALSYAADFVQRRAGRRLDQASSMAAVLGYRERPASEEISRIGHVRSILMPVTCHMEAIVRVVIELRSIEMRSVHKPRFKIN